MATPKNATIKSTEFGFQDHGILNFWLHLDFGGSGQGYGGYHLGGTRFSDGECRSWVFPEFARQLFLAVEVDSWEKLPGTPVRVIAKDDEWSAPLVKIGHYLKDQWVDISEICEEARMQRGEQ